MRRLGVFLALAIIGCDGDSSPDAGDPSSAEAQVNTSPPGMSKYPYLASDGGPHLLLPAEAAGSWTGARSMADVMNPRSDYGRACGATTNTRMALIPVGSSSAIVFGGPPMTAWGKSADGLVEVYYLESWTSMDLDALIAKATAAMPTAALTDSGQLIQFDRPDAFLLYAGDTPSSVTYHCHRISVPVGTYKILVGTYSAQGDSVTVYRLKPTGT
jgi:Immunity protein 21